MRLNFLGETTLVAGGSAVFSRFDIMNQNPPIINVKSWVLDEKDEKIEQLEARIQELEDRITQLERKNMVIGQSSHPMVLTTTTDATTIIARYPWTTK